MDIGEASVNCTVNPVPDGSQLGQNPGRVNIHTPKQPRSVYISPLTPALTSHLTIHCSFIKSCTDSFFLTTTTKYTLWRRRRRKRTKRRRRRGAAWTSL